MVGGISEDSGGAHPHPLPAHLASILANLPLDLLAFTPVPVKARRDGWTPARQIGFIHRLALCGDVASAARGVGMSRESAWRLRARAGAESFAAAWDEAAGWGADRMADLGMERCLLGEVRPVYYKGRKVGENLRFDDRLLIAVLNRFGNDGAQAPLDEDPVATLNRALTGLTDLAPEPPLKTNVFPRDSA